MYERGIIMSDPWQCAYCGKTKTTDDMSSQEPTFCQECYDNEIDKD